MSHGVTKASTPELGQAANDIVLKCKARGPGEDRGLQCVTPLRGDRWEGVTLEIEFNTISSGFASHSFGAFPKS
jgi:hypothetical protein